MRLKISATALDSHDYYKSSNMNDDAYAARLRGEETTSDAAALGHAFHSVVEHISLGLTPFSLEYKFDFSDVDVEIPQPDLVETAVRREYDIAGDLITVSGRLDAVCGTIGVDYKTSARPPDVDRFRDAKQWRTYLSLFPSLRKFRYDVFQLKRPRRSDEDPKKIKVVKHARVEFLRYNGLEQDVHDAIYEYVEFLKFYEKLGRIKLTPKGVYQTRPRTY